MAVAVLLALGVGALAGCSGDKSSGMSFPEGDFATIVSDWCAQTAQLNGPPPQDGVDAFHDYAVRYLQNATGLISDIRGLGAAKGQKEQAERFTTAFEAYLGPLDAFVVAYQDGDEAGIRRFMEGDHAPPAELVTAIDELNLPGCRNLL